MKSLWSIFLSGIIYALLLCTPARAATRYVGTPNTAIGSNSGCGSIGYVSIQSAVDAASPGDTVYLCGTAPFDEQIIINKTLSLTGDAGATIQPPDPFPTTPASPGLPSQFESDNLNIPQAIVIVWGAGVTVTITHLTIAGPLPGGDGCAEDEFGVLAIAGATVSLDRDNIENIHDANSSLSGCQFGVAVQVGREWWPASGFSGWETVDFVGHADITATTISGYQKNGITVDGLGSNATISGDTLRGSNRDASFSPTIAQNGIQISWGAGGQIRKNTIAGNTYMGPYPASSAGVLIFGGSDCGLVTPGTINAAPLVTGVQVTDNTLTNNDVGVSLTNLNPTCSTYPLTRTNDKVMNNTIANDEVTNVGGPWTFDGTTYDGYQAGVEDIGNNDKIINNDISGIGYDSAQTISDGSGPFVTAVDTATLTTAGARVHANTAK